MPTSAQWQEAREHTRSTMQPGDASKWGNYKALDSQAALEWRKAQGHAEYCRLQRLAFWAFI